jgi:DNA polymerase-3 subunit beta
VGNTKLTTRLIEGEFPNYAQLLPKTAMNELTVSRDDLLDAVRRVKILARDSTPVRLQMTSEVLRVEAISQDVGNAFEELDASYNGPDLTVAFNPDYLVSGLEACSGEKVVLSTTDALKPAVVRGEGISDYLYLLMPVRV